MVWHTSKEQHGRRFWWHFGEHRRAISLEFYWWSPRFGFSVGPDDDGWNISLRVPPLALYLSIEGFPLWQPTRRVIATWDNNRVMTLPDRRECDFYIADWRVQFTPWGRWGEWNKADPWWVRGVSFDIVDLVLGKARHSKEELALVPCVVPMPEGKYPAVCKIERHTWNRPRWFAHRRVCAWLDIPGGIPHSGKGENSWDCGDDGLWGIGGDSVDDAIARAQAAVLKDRGRYGEASAEAMQEATSRCVR